MKTYFVKLYYGFLNKIKKQVFKFHFPDRVASVESKFDFIYKNGYWGKSENEKFYSGLGSHKTEIIEPYLNAVIAFLNERKEKLNIVDLGCGDFNIGSRISPYTNEYVACDIVTDLIEYNKKQFQHLKNVDFIKLNIIDDELPDGDICCIREVFQHLGNDDIQCVINKLNKYKYIMFTEHIPYSPFDPNKDQTAGFDTRLSNNSGVQLCFSPFNFKYTDEKLVCTVDVGNGVVNTYLYTI